MKIILTNFHKQGFGQISYVQLVARLLAERGHEVAIACPEGSWLAERAEAAGLQTETQFRFSRGFTPFDFSRDVLEARKMMRRLKPDVIHANGSQDHWIMTVARNLFGLPPAIVRTKHNSFPMRTHLSNRFLSRRLTHRWIVVCEAVRQDLLAGPLFKPEDIKTIHNGLEIEIYEPKDGRAERAEFGLAPDDFVIGSLGRLTPAKGHRYLFEAVAPLMKEPGSNLRVLLVGYGEEQPNLERQCEELGITRFVKFAGVRDDVPRMISMFDIGVLASIDCESSSFALKEMMAMGVPCVCTDFAGNAEIVEHEVSGLVVPPASSEGLHAAIERLWKSPELCERFEAAARERIKTGFSAEVCIDKTMEVYREAMQCAGLDPQD